MFSHEIVIPTIFAEAEGGNDFHDAVVSYERSQQSVGPEPALERQPEPQDDGTWSKSFVQAIKESKPLLSEEDRETFEAIEMQENEIPVPEETEEDDSEEEEIVEEEDELGDNPLDEFDPEEVAKLVDKYKLSEEDLQDPRVANMLARQLMEQDATEQAQRQPQTDQEHYEVYIKELQRVASDPTVNDPQMLQAFENTLAQCFGADSPESRANVKNLSGALVMGGLNLMSSVVPQIVQHVFADMVEQHLPGLARNHFDAVAHNSWVDVRNQDPAFRDLPADINSPEFEELRQKVLTENKWLQTITFRDEQGRQLHPDHPSAVNQAAHIFAKLAVGQKLTPETVAKAVAQGEKKARSHERRVSASRSLSSGRPSGSAFKPSRDDDFADSIRQYMSAQYSRESE